MQRRGTILNPQNRFQPVALEVDPADQEAQAASPKNLATQWFWDDTRTIVTENDSPDIPFRYSVNPYRGCEHGCAYCYARTYHEYLGWNAGADFETRILVKQGAADLLRDWLTRPAWNGSEAVMMSGVTDPYQPIEKKLQITRGLLQVFREARQAMGLITKNALVTRDIDLLADMATDSLVQVALSVTTLDKELAMKMEPRCSVPEARLRAIRELSQAGIPVHVNMAPIIPGLNDHEIPSVVEAIARAGARSVSWILLRLPGAVEPVFENWLSQYYLGQQSKVLDRLRQMRGGRVSDSQFGRRMRGEGPLADQWSQWFGILRKKWNLLDRLPSLNTRVFRPPGSTSGQKFLF